MTLAPDVSISDANREALAKLISALACDKAVMGRRYGEWAVSAPTLESAVAAAAMAQDELGHARSTFPLLKQLGADDDDHDHMDVHSTMPLLDGPLPDWDTFIAANLVIDGLLARFVEAAVDSSFVPLAQRARKIRQEERSHRAHAAAWARRLARDDAQRPAFRDALATCWTLAERWVPDAAEYADLAAAGVVAGSADDLIAGTRASVSAALAGTPLAEDWAA